jgi:hypothetical protein
MNNKTNLQKIQALKIINDNTVSAIDIANLLFQDGIISNNDMLELKHKKDKSEYLFILLERANREDRLDLLDFEWQILPIERVRLTIITKSNLHQFGYGD